MVQNKKYNEHYQRQTNTQDIGYVGNTNDMYNVDYYNNSKK